MNLNEIGSGMSNPHLAVLHSVFTKKERQQPQVIPVEIILGMNIIASPQTNLSRERKSAS